MVSVREISDTVELTAFEPVWQALFERAPDPTPFQSYEWQGTWWKHHGRGQLFVLVARRGDEVVGLMPLSIAAYRGTPFRQVRFLGAPLSDFQEILATPEAMLDCRAAFMAYLQAQSHRWDLCDFPDQRAGTTLATLAPGDGDGLRRTLVHHRVCPFIPLAPTWDAFSARLSKNTRTNLGRRRRQVAKQFHAEYDLAAPETLHQALEELFELHNTRWQRRGVSGAFAGERMQAFHHEVARRFLERGWLRLHRLKLDGQTRAAFYCFQRGARVYYYLSGFDYAFSKYSIGNVLMARAIETAIGEGAREFDFLRGDETYKFAWKAEERETLRLILGHAALRSSLALRAHSLERYLEIKGLALQRWMWGRKQPLPQATEASAAE
jgi:CelD/BcsL family acetyltransferase involved in cellulose biosynthesis